MWLICCSCHRTANAKVRQGAKLVCSNCGGRAVRRVQQVKQHMLNGGQITGDQAKTLTYAALVSIAQARGYKIGWAAMKYRQIFVDWPPREIPEPMQPSGELMWWIKRQSIEYVKQKKALEASKDAKTSSDSEEWNDAERFGV